MAHTNGAGPVYDALLAGVDSVEHGNYMDDECIRAFSQSKAVWVPTVTVVPNLIGCGRFSDTVLESIWRRAGETIRKAWKAGVTMALGSDAGAYLVPHGQGLLDEWERFKSILSGGKGSGNRDLELGGRGRLKKNSSFVYVKFEVM